MYRARRSFLHGGQQVQAGDTLTFEGVAAGRLQSMVRLGFITPAPVAEDYGKLTKAALVDVLNDAGVEVPAGAKKQQLVALAEGIN